MQPLLEPWTLADALDLYELGLWGQGYFGINKKGNVCVQPSKDPNQSIDLNELVYGVLKPAVTDYRGTICLIGMPGNLKKGLFFELTQGQDPGSAGTWSKMGWSGHRWSASACRCSRAGAGRPASAECPGGRSTTAPRPLRSVRGPKAGSAPCRARWIRSAGCRRRAPRRRCPPGGLRRERPPRPSGTGR